MAKRISNRRRGQRGQSAVIGIVALIILAIGMYTTYNLSRTVYEKIRLQNTADAAAYSLANLEARTFNFIAFANRAQVANYVQMMEAQAILSNATYLEGALGLVGDVMVTTGNNLILASYTPWTSGLRAPGEALVNAGKTMDQTVRMPVTQAINAWENIGTTQKFMQWQSLTNTALFAVSTMLALTTVAHLADGGRTIIAENDPEARPAPGVELALTGINIWSYGAAFDYAAMGISGNDRKKAEAKRLMAEIANASRFGTAPRRYVASRKPLDLIVAGLSPGGDAGIPDEAVDAIEDVATSTNDDMPGDAMNAMSDALSFLLGPSYVGTAKLLTADGELPDLDDTAEKGPETSALARGNAITAKDISRLPYGALAKRGFASLRSSKDDSEHCRWVKPEGFGWRKWGATVITSPIRLAFIFNLLIPSNDPITRNSVKRMGFRCYKEGEEDGENVKHKHKWENPIIGGDGIGPYIKFAPKLEGISAEGKSFNQPDVWIMLNKPPDGLALDNDMDLSFGIENQSERAELDARIGEDGPLFPGINVVTRAQVYYHRPGAWHEPPNFFNPYWNARLAPKGAAISRLLNVPGLELGNTEIGGMIVGFVRDNVWMH